MRYWPLHGPNRWGWGLGALTSDEAGKLCDELEHALSTRHLMRRTVRQWLGPRLLLTCDLVSGHTMEIGFTNTGDHWVWVDGVGLSRCDLEGVVTVAVCLSRGWWSRSRVGRLVTLQVQPADGIPLTFRCWGTARWGDLKDRTMPAVRPRGADAIADASPGRVPAAAALVLTVLFVLGCLSATVLLVRQRETLAFGAGAVTIASAVIARVLGGGHEARPAWESISWSFASLMARGGLPWRATYWASWVWPAPLFALVVSDVAFV